MPTSTPAANPDALAILNALSREGLSSEDAYNATEGVRNMAGQTIAAEIKAHSASIGAKIEAQNAKIEAQNAYIAAQNAKTEAQNARLDALAGLIAAQDSKLRMLMWMIGAAVAVIGILIRLWG